SGGEDEFYRRQTQDLYLCEISANSLASPAVPELLETRPCDDGAGRFRGYELHQLCRESGERSRMFAVTRARPAHFTSMRPAAMCASQSRAASISSSPLPSE